MQGLQGSIAVEREVYRAGEPIRLTVTLTNVSDAPIDIDPWPGNWFVRVFDEEANIVPPVTHAANVIRPVTISKTLRPGESWSMPVEGLRLVTGLPGSILLWDYGFLKPGVYWLGAEYTALPAVRPDSWFQGLDCEWVKITVADL